MMICAKFSLCQSSCSGEVENGKLKKTDRQDIRRKNVAEALKSDEQKIKFKEKNYVMKFILNDNICICTNKTCHNFKTVYNLWQQESETMKTENIINNPNNKL